MLRNTLKNIGLALLLCYLGLPSLYWPVQYFQIILKHNLCQLRNKAIFRQKYTNYTSKLKPCKNKTFNWSKGFKRLILCGWKMPVILLISQFVSITAKSQSDTLTTQELSKYYSLIGLINTDLKDYDLVKEKSAIQEKQIKGLEAISRKQQEISIRKEYKLELYANSNLQLQAQNVALQSELRKAKRQRGWAKLENWLWRGGVVLITIKILFK